MEKSSAPIVCPGHQKAIFGLHYSPLTPDGYFLMSATHDKLPMIRNADSGDWIGTFEGHKGAVWDAKLNATATLAATASADFTAKLWDATTGDLIFTYEHQHIVRAIDFSPDGTKLVTGGKKKIIRVFSVTEPGEPLVKMNQASAITKALWTPDGTFIITGGEDGVLRKWKSETGDLVAEIAVGMKAINDVEISSDKTLLTIATDSSVHIVKLDNFEPVKILKLGYPCDAISLHPSNKVLLVGGADMLIHKVSLEEEGGKELFVYRGHHGPVHCVRHHPTGSSFSSGSGDATIRIWQC